MSVAKFINTPNTRSRVSTASNNVEDGTEGLTGKDQVGYRIREVAWVIRVKNSTHLETYA